MGQQYSTHTLTEKKAAPTTEEVSQLRNSWEEALKLLESIQIDASDARCLTASGYADALIGSVRGVLRHLEENDPINAFRIMRTTLECLVKFKHLIKSELFLEKLKTNLSHYRKRLFNRAKDPEKGVGLEALSTAPCDDIDFNQNYERLNFENLCKELGWIQLYNLVYWHCSSVSHVDLDQIYLTFTKNEDGQWELKPYGESTHDQDFQLALNLMEWFEKQFSSSLIEFEKIQHSEN